MLLYIGKENLHFLRKRCMIFPNSRTGDSTLFSTIQWGRRVLSCDARAFFPGIDRLAGLCGAPFPEEANRGAADETLFFKRLLFREVEI